MSDMLNSLSIPRGMKRSASDSTDVTMRTSTELMYAQVSDIIANGKIEIYRFTAKQLPLLTEIDNKIKSQQECRDEDRLASFAAGGTSGQDEYHDYGNDRDNCSACSLDKAGGKMMSIDYRGLDKAGVKMGMGNAPMKIIAGDHHGAVGNDFARLIRPVALPLRVILDYKSASAHPCTKPVEKSSASAVVTTTSGLGANADINRVGSGSRYRTGGYSKH